MKRSYIEEISKKSANQKILLKGWVAEIRDLNKIKFLILRDKTGVIQTIALEKKTPQESFDLISKINPESVVEIQGKVLLNKEAKDGYEILIDNLILMNQAQVPLPIDTSSKSNTKIDKRLDYRFLDARRPEVAAIFKIRSKIIKYGTDFFDENGFINCTSPKITITGLESGAELFKMNYFGKNAYLSQSPQLYKQMFVASGFEKVYDIGPVFRAEKSHTTRHLTEFTGIDFEMGFIENEHDVMDVIEQLFIYIIKNVKKDCKKELELLGLELNIPKKIPRIPMDEVKTMLAEKGKKLKQEDDLDAEAEQLLGHIIKNKFGSDFVFVTLYPFAVRPFYHMLDEKGKSKSFDLIYNGVEICTGAQREHRLEILEKQAKQKGIKLEKIYTDIMKYGIPPHGGVGLGLDRITHRLLELPNIREAILLPRDPERLTP